jgi:pyruvate/2-oxoglutarate dehydrogenase complex dihydrolipoamide dehydrogenase (E3) component
VRGAARFVEPQTIDVQGRQLRADRFILCTGAEPMVPRIPGIESVPYLTHETVFDLTELPSRLLVLGGGPIGVELAQAFQRLGSAVTVLEREASILPEVDAEARALLAAQLQEDGVRLLTGNSVSHVAAHGSEIAAMVDGQIVVADAVLVATGRKPRVEELALDRAGVALGADGIAVDARLRTSQRHIYACGDVAAQVQLTHYAGFQGTIAARNALLPGSEPGTRPAVPWVLFTDPEVGQAGIRDDEARARWRDVRVTRLPLEQVDRAQTAGDTRGFIKLISRGVSGRLVGATVVASNGGELVNELALAIERRLRLSEVARVMHVYPTYGLGIQQAGAAALFDDLRSAGLQGKLLRLLARYWP